MTPFLTARAASMSLVVFCAVYAFIFAFGTFYIYRLLRTGPVGPLVLPPMDAVPNRPLSVVGPEAHLSLKEALHSSSAGAVTGEKSW